MRYVLRKEAGLLGDAVWQDLNDRQNRARFLTWRLYVTLRDKPPPTSRSSTNLDH
jgi:hypothetical protein